MATGGGTDQVVTLREHLAALRHADERLEAERDRRYAEVNIEREKALKIKETADLAALGLAREIQNYKDEKANELREQINSERGLYVTNKDFETVKNFIAAQTGRGVGMNALAGWAVALLAVGIAAANYFKP